MMRTELMLRDPTLGASFTKVEMKKPYLKVDKSYPFVTIEYARQKLGKKGEKMTDQQIADLLATLRIVCNKTIDSVVKVNHEN